MRAVNLLPKDETRGRQPTPVPLLLGIPLALLATVGLGAGYLQAAGKVTERHQRLESLTAQEAALPKVPATSAIEQTLVSQRTPRITALGAALSRRVAWDRLLREVSQVLPDDVWLDNLQLTSPNPAVATVPPTAPVPGAVATGVLMSGSTYSPESVARLLARMQLVPDLTNVQLQEGHITKVGAQDVIKFTILADVRLAGATS